jgi:hexosaminidase
LLHTFEQGASWIYQPAEVNLYYSVDGVNFKNQHKPSITIAGGHHLFTFECDFEAKFIRINAINSGTIPEGKPGAGNKAWLFADEIEIK